MGLEAGHQRGTVAAAVAFGTVCLHLESLYITQMLGSLGFSHKVSRKWLLLSNLWLTRGDSRKPRDLDVQSVQTLTIVVLLLSAPQVSSFIHLFISLLFIKPLRSRRWGHREQDIGLCPLEMMF